MRRFSWLATVLLALAITVPSTGLYAQSRMIGNFYVNNAGATDPTGNYCHTLAEITEIAKFELFSSSPGSNPCYTYGGLHGWAAIKKLNPNIKIIVYRSSPSLLMYSTVFGPPSTCPDAQTCLNWLEANHGQAASNSERWFQKGVNFLSRLVGGSSGGYGDAYPMRYGNMGWLNFWITNVLDDIGLNRRYPFYDLVDGYFHDNWDRTGAVTIQANNSGGPVYHWQHSNDPAWRDYSDDYYTSSGFCDPVTCRQAIANEIDVFNNLYNPKAASARLFNVHNFMPADENAVSWAHMDALKSPPKRLFNETALWRRFPVGYPGWKYEVDAYAALQNIAAYPQCTATLSTTDLAKDMEGRLQSTDAVSSYPVWRGLWYCLSSAMMAYNPTGGPDGDGNLKIAYIALPVSGTQEGRSNFWNEFNPNYLHMGVPTGAYFVVNGLNSCGIYFRPMTDGWFVVNPCNEFTAGIPVPSGLARSITHNELLTANSQPLVSSFTMQGFSGRLLLREGRDITNADNLGGSPPAPVPAPPQAPAPAQPPAAPPSPPPQPVQVTTPTYPFIRYQLVNRGGLSVMSEGSAATATVGYAKIQPNLFNATAAGVAILGLRQNGVLVTEAGVPASPKIRSGRIYAEMDSRTLTGLAIANPADQDATVDYYFTGPDGVNFGGGKTTVPARSQIAHFLNENPFNGPSSFVGTFSFSSNTPVSAIALRGYRNERSEFLITTLTVVDLSVTPANDEVLQPHFADGGGWTSQVLLVNPTDQTIRGVVEFRDAGTPTTPGAPISLTVEGQTGNSFAYTLPPRSSQRLRTSGTSATTKVGSIRIIPQSGNPTPVGLGVFSFRRLGVMVSEASVPAVRAARTQRMFAEISKVDGIVTGLAVASTSTAPEPITFELFTLSGTPVGQPATLTVPANGQIVRFLNELPGFDSPVLPFQGVVRISSSSAAGVFVTGLRGHTNERDDFLVTTTPPIMDSGPASNEEMFFPHFVSGAGYSTQFILFNAREGAASAGSLSFFGQSGQTQNMLFR